MTQIVEHGEELRKKILAVLGISERTLQKEGARKEQEPVRPRRAGGKMIIRIKNPVERFIRIGFPISTGDHVKAVLGLTDSQIAESLGISVRTLQRKRKKQERLSMVESDRLYRISRIFAKATQVLGNDEMAKNWMNRPQYGLGWRIPIEMIQTEAGASEVENLLGRIEHGIIT